MNLLDMIDAQDTNIQGRVSPQEFASAYLADQPEIVAFDTESPTYKWHLPNAVPFALTFSWGGTSNYYVPCSVNGVVDQDAAEVLYQVLATAPVLVGHHIKYDLHVAKRLLDPFGIPLLLRRIEDTMILDAVLNENRHHGLKERCTDLGISFDGRDADALKTEVAAWIDQASKRENREVGYDEVPPRLIVPYAIQDAYLTFELYRHQRTDLDEQVANTKYRRDLHDIYTLELRLLWVLFQMEERGMRIDLDFVWEQVSALAPTLDHERLKLGEELGFALNPLATDDVAEALKDLGHGDALWTNPKTGKVNLPEWRLEQLEDDPNAGDLVRRVLTYRTNAKMLNSYFEPLLHENADDGTGQAIVRCNNKQMGARTGRMSVTEPALQTLPKKKGQVRAAFISRREHHLLFADYSQQELRVLAHYMRTVGDDSMAKIFETDVIDLHRETASAIFDVDYDDVTEDQRDDGKQTNFAIVYGAGVKKIAAMHGCDEETAKLRLNRLYRRFPGIQVLKRTCEKRMRERGYIVTAFGRRHREDDSKYYYKSVNSLIQGTSADVTKQAMIRIDDAFRAARMDSMVLLQVHDEVLTESPLAEVEEAERITRQAMLDVPEIWVPMDVKITVSDRWATPVRGG